MQTIIYCHERWAEITKGEWLAAFSKRPVEKLPSELLGLVDELEQNFLQPGVATHKPTPVVLHGGRMIGPHRHPEHLIIYYPIGHPGKLITEDGEYTPVKNTAIYLPPNTLHSVGRNSCKSPRLSLALRWKTT